MKYKSITSILSARGVLLIGRGFDRDMKGKAENKVGSM
jgi:hypothetical protein